MNEVEKMYRNAHVYPRVYGDITKETFENKVFNMVDMCNEAFTAEKQLKIMAFLINRKVGLSLKAEQGKITIEAISRGLADTVNRIWQDLTEDERLEIKNILEM